MVNKLQQEKLQYEQFVEFKGMREDFLKAIEANAKASLLGESSS